ncbi:response regulator [Agrobacterium sp.]|uniref:response regulator n=1 Tax=Agrobacterium sp. TaxID=361 RepID=UPI0028ACD059|nr:response regulator [Agrobacterium sp.]
MYQRTVLIVDDEALIRMMLADFLEEEGYAIIEASNALEAVIALETRKPDAVITDIDMPGGINGLDLAQHVATCRQGLPVIVTSGGHLVGPEALPGSAKFIAKPYEPEHVLEILSDLIAQQQGHENSVTAMRTASLGG